MSDFDGQNGQKISIGILICYFSHSPSFFIAEFNSSQNQYQGTIEKWVVKNFMLILPLARGIQ